MKAYLVLIEHEFDTTEIYGFFTYRDALLRAAKIIEERCVFEIISAPAAKRDELSHEALSQLVWDWNEACSEHREVWVHDIELE